MNPASTGGGRDRREALLCVYTHRLSYNRLGNSAYTIDSNRSAATSVWAVVRLSKDVLLTGEFALATTNVPADIEAVLTNAWKATENVPGHLQQNEALFLGILAACVPASGAIVEIGSFQGRSTVMLAKVASHYGGGPVVAIDPHNSPILLDHSNGAGASSYEQFLHSLRSNEVEKFVEPHVAYSTDVAKAWNRPIRILWIDGDHSLKGASDDLDAFLPYLVPHGVVAFHDALNPFPGPIRVFVEQVLASDRFGPSGFVHSIAWAQYRRMMESDSGSGGQNCNVRRRGLYRLWRVGRNCTVSGRSFISLIAPGFRGRR